MYRYKNGLTENARQLRGAMTPEEMHRWLDFLRGLPVVVKRQFCIKDYIVDFYVPRAKLVIELDGSQHGEPLHRQADEKRDNCLSALGIRVLRYRNEDVRDRFFGVCEDVLKHLRSYGVQV